MQKYSKVIPTENDSSKEIIKSTGHLGLRRCEITVQRLKDGGRKLNRIRPVRPHCKICPNVSTHTSKGSLEMFVSRNQKHSKNPNIGTWCVPTYERTLCVCTKCAKNYFKD